MPDGSPNLESLIADIQAGIQERKGQKPLSLPTIPPPCYCGNKNRRNGFRFLKRAS